MDNGFFCFILVLIIIMAGVPAFFVLTTHRYTKTYDCYYIKAPFGVFWVNTDGRFFLGCGGINSELEESYVIKYFYDDGTLRSLTVSAEKTPVIIDNTLRVTLNIGEGPFYTRKAIHIVKIHVPFLPEINYPNSSITR